MVVPNNENALHWADYVVFAGFLATSTGIGIFFGWKAKKNAALRTAESFLTGGGEMHFLPVALSMMASFLSAIFVLSNPAEFYNYGTTYIFNCIGYLIGNGIAAHLHLPIIARLGITSGYQYLELRFNRAVRIAGSLSFSVMILLYMSVTLYLPALALQQATSLDLEIAILTVGIVVTFYTAVGGMKATVWNDALQMIIVTTCLILLIILGSVEVEKTGMGSVFDLAEKGGRLRFNDASTYDPNPLRRLTFWSTTVGGTFVNLTLYASSQTIIQKFISTGNVRSGQLAVWISSIVTVLNMILVMILGLVMYAYYYDCDPQIINAVEKKDQMVPLFVMQVMGHLHGMPGLFLATTFSASLSSVSGSVNSLAAVFLEDMIKPAVAAKTGKPISDKSAAIATRSLAVFFGVLTIALSFAAQYFGALVLQVAISVFGMVGSPLAGLLSVGMLVPCVNSWGAMAGLIVSLALTCWIGIGAVVANIPQPTLVMNTFAEGCLPNSTLNGTDIVTTLAPNDDFLAIYELSYMHYSLFAIAVVFIVAIPVSYITGRQDPETLDPRLLFSFGDEWGCCCPRSCVEACRCKVQYKRDTPYYNNRKRWKSVSYDNEEFDVVEYKTSDARESGKENIAYVKEQEFGTSPPPYDDDNVNSTRF